MNTVVFDLGGVLVDWNPRYLLRDVMPDREDEMETILTDVMNHEWNMARDRGDSWPDAMAQLESEYPQWADVFQAYNDRWGEMLGGDLPDTVEILRELKSSGVPLLALSNWSAEKFPEAEKRFEWLEWFDGVVVSGRIKMVKPDAEIFDYLLGTYGLKAGDIFFIDDNEANIISARALGIRAHHFHDAGPLRDELTTAGFLE
jgi:2-haloacid dehalogenase